MKISKLNSAIDDIFRNLIKLKKQINDPDLYRLIEDYQQSYQSQEYRISVVGEFSSGKSTFLNALIGCNILPHAKSETTATITYIHNVPDGDRLQNKAYVYFSEKNKASIQIDLSQNPQSLDKYTRVNDEVDVAHKISHVDIYIHFANIQDNIVLVDTPGMNGVADGHRNLTLNEIQHSNASICLFHLKGIGKTDLNFIRELMKYQDKFYFILNGIDDLKISEGETYESRLKTFRNELSRSLPELPIHKMSIYGVSALNALVSRDKSIRRLYENDKEDLTEIDRKKCWERSKFDLFENDLYSFLQSDEKSKHFYVSLLTKLSSLLTDKIASLSTSLQINTATIENCPERKALIKMRDSVTEKIEQLIKDVENHLGSKMSDLEYAARDMMKKDIQTESNLLYDKVNGLDYNNINQFIEERTLGKSLESFYGTITNKLSSFMYCQLSIIYSELISRMSNAMPRISFSNSKINITSGGSFDETDARFESSDHVNRLQDKIDKYKREIKQNEKRIQEAYDTQKKIQKAETDLRIAQNERNQEMRNMGSRPSVTWRKETYHRPRRGLFSFITNVLLGDKEDTRMVKDDSLGKEWDREMNRIKHQANTKIAFLQKSLETLENSASNVDANYYQRMYQQLIKQKEIAEQDLRRSIEQNRREMEFARSSAVKNKKKQMLQDIDNHLNMKSGIIYTVLLDGILKYTSESQGTMKKDLRLIYDRKSKEFMGQLNDLIHKKSGDSNSDILKKSDEYKTNMKCLQPILDTIDKLIK